MPWDESGHLAVDVHVHSVASGHAFGTVGELLRVAAERGLCVLGISDHGPAMAGAPQEGYFTMAPDFARWPSPVRLLLGCEANILDLDGGLDLSPRTLAALDYVMAGLHSRTAYDQVGNTPENNTRAVLACLERHSPDVLTHPLNPRFPLHLGDVVRSAARCGVTLEVNARVLWDAPHPLVEEHRRFLDRALTEGAALILGSDAHIPPLVGDVTPLRPLLGALHAARDRIVNADGERFLAWLQDRRRASGRGGGRS
jgi:putative hydrolase